MFLDHPSITATNAQTESDRLERLQRVYGYAMALADAAGNAGFVDKLTKVNRGRAYYSSVDNLESSVFVDYLRNRRRKLK